MTATQTTKTKAPAVQKPRVRNWDQSVLQISPEDLAELDDEEQGERAWDEINRAIDLLEAVADAFGSRVQPDRISKVVRELKSIARSM